MRAVGSSTLAEGGKKPKSRGGGGEESLKGDLAVSSGEG